MIDWHNPSSLERAIEAAELTQKQFAIDAGVPPSSLNRFLKGRNLPTCENLRKLEAAYAKLTKNTARKSRRKAAQNGYAESAKANVA